MPNITTSPPPSPAHPSKGATITIFALVGPLVGSLAFMMAIVVGGKTAGEYDAVFFGVILALGFALGIVPAALTGLAVAQTRRSSLPTPLRGALFGAAIATLFWVLGFGGLGGLTSGFAAMGAVAGLVCGGVSDWWSRQEQPPTPAGSPDPQSPS